jgi:acyl-coenzyme A synthetase/AMP-(fatty) acid ligase
MLMFGHFAFDAGVVDIFSALLSGAALYPFSLGTPAGFLALPETLLREQITVWHSVPSLFRHFTGSLAGGRTFPSVRLVLLGGESIRPQDVAACRKHFPNATFGNLYGQTESSINSLWLLPPGTEDYQLSLGDPLPRTQLLVSRDDGSPVEPLGTGQIVVASRHIARGYLAEPALTARAFADDPHLGKLYWSGDLGRLLPDGRIVFIGRRDHQVKINGIRVELEEIEQHLCRHPAVLNAVVAIIGTAGETNGLACYWEPRPGCEPVPEPEIRRFLATFLPAGMIPGCYMEVREWPRNANGKINRKALPEIRPQLAAPLAAAASALEEQIRRIWQTVLKRETVALDVNFFDAGGNSLKLLQLQSLFAQSSGREVPLARFFEYPTVRKFAAFLSPSAADAPSADTTPIAPENRLRIRQHRLRKT